MCKCVRKYMNIPDRKITRSYFRTLRGLVNIKFSDKATLKTCFYSHTSRLGGVVGKLARKKE